MTLRFLLAGDTPDPKSKIKSKKPEQNQKPVAFKKLRFFQLCFALFNVRSEHFQQAPTGARSMLLLHTGKPARCS